MMLAEQQIDAFEQFDFFDQVLGGCGVVVGGALQALPGRRQVLAQRLAGLDHRLNGGHGGLGRDRR